MFWKDIETQIIIIIAWIVISVFATAVIDTLMNVQIKKIETKQAADDKALKEKSAAISKARLLNSSWEMNTSIATGSSMTATWNPFPKIIIK
jgi:hypothetical protein